MKKRSLRATNLRKGTLTGAEINESKLGSVPRADVAARAGTADTLSGTPASGFVKPESLALGAVQAAALQNGWIQAPTFSTVGWYTDPAGLVHLQGLAMSGNDATAVFTLPPGLRPAMEKAFGVICGNVPGYLEILSNDSVNVYDQPSGDCGGFVSFEGVVFRPGT